MRCKPCDGTGQLPPVDRADGNVSTPCGRCEGTGSVSERFVVEFDRTASVVERERDGKHAIDLEMVQIATVYVPGSDGKKPRKPTIKLVGTDFADLLRTLEHWHGLGAPTLAEAKTLQAQIDDEERRADLDEARMYGGGKDDA